MGVYNFAYFNGKLGASHEPVPLGFWRLHLPSMLTLNPPLPSLSDCVTQAGLTLHC